jgi:lysophospholipase L1-like esterase
MKRFLKHISIFTSILLGTLLMFLIVIKILNKKLMHDFKIKKSTRVLFLGDSHIEQAINDQYIPNSVNLAKQAEPYFYTYQKLKNICVSNHQIDTLFLGYSYHNISYKIEEFIHGKYKNDIIPKYILLLTLKEQINILIDNFSDFPTIFKYGTYFGTKNLFTKNPKKYSFLGEYKTAYETSRANSKTINIRIYFHFSSKNQKNPFSNENLLYFNKIIQLCKANKIHLILLSTPLHKEYQEKVPKIYRDKYYQLIQENKLDYVHFEDQKFADDCFTPNGDHLTIKGVKQISENYRKWKILSIGEK